MKTTRLIIAFFCLFAVLSCDKDSTTASEDEATLETPNMVAALDYQLYSLVLTETQSSAKIIVKQKSATSISLSDDSSSDTYVNHLKNEFSELESVLFANYRKTNAATVNFDNKFSVKTKSVSLIGEKQLASIFSGSDVNGGWTKFNTTYPDASGYITFSQIGYNSTQTQAILEIGHFYGSLGADGAIVILKKENGAWKILKIQATWVS
jgi:hypothetical protein